MAKRATRTVPVLDLLVRANALLACGGFPGETNEACRAFRRGVAAMIEHTLHETGNYAGFGYLDSPYVEGVTDETRRSYYYGRAVQAVARERA